MTWITKPRRELDTAAVCRRYCVCDTTLDRWLSNRSRGFPEPNLNGRRRFWLESDLDAYDAAGLGKPLI
ncbi:transcriptional regulator [Mesorhizobium sp. B3-1-7]|uniref:transcriptional regulator n=1 Tax=Mesorhizobium sp. B3-1-7 TaxID=2589894 RepID=UPI00112B4E11|nr:transcriptional regulator [Mesorhizobium sp. B3-1-7]TPI54732.1 transcriptional regulator [Mesorhizobium sp. B3-1-7]